MTHNIIQSYKLTMCDSWLQMAALITRFFDQHNERIEALESALATAQSTSRLDDRHPDGGARPGDVSGREPGRGGEGANNSSSKFPRWVPPNRNSQRAFSDHCHTLGFEPSEEEIGQMMNKLDMQHNWTRITMATRMDCNPTEAMAWAYFGKTLGFLEYIEGRRHYRKIK